MLPLIARSLLLSACCGLLFSGAGIPAAVLAAPAPEITLAFYDAPLGDRRDLLARIDDLTHLAPVWFHLAANGELQGDADRDLVVLAHQHSVEVFPVVQNYRAGAFRGEDLRALASPAGRHALTAQIARAVVDASADGIDLDFEELPPALGGDLVTFVSELSTQLRRMGKKVVVDLPVQHRAYDARRLAASADWLLLMAYDQHSLPGEPGPIAAFPWVESALGELARQVPANQIILGLGGYGYDWGPKRVEPLSFAAALSRAARPEVIQWDPAARAPWFAYTGADGSHTVWFNDAASFQPLLRLAERNRVAGVSLWRLGVEDSGAWELMGRGIDSSRLEGLEVVAVNSVRDGSGEMVRTGGDSGNGRRAVTRDPDTEEITGERYLRLPRAEVLTYASLLPGTIALTFDDGPDPRWTPRILDILQRYRARATFFVIGNRAARYPDLLARIYAGGHEIGNHTYTHAAGLGQAPDWRFALELSLTQRLIEGATGHSATLFRYPYLPALTELGPDEEPLVKRPSRMGYWLVGYGTDTADWTQPGAAQIATRALSASRPEEQIILLHDGGGDRAETVAALPIILDGLQARGLRAVPIGEAAGQTRRAAMPPISASSVALGRVFMGSVWTIEHAAKLFWGAVTVALLLGFVRTILLGGLGFLQWIVAPRIRRPYQGPVTAVVPAHNEEAVIARTLDALLASSYTDLEIIVVDDGSTDRTVAIVARYARRGVRLIRQANAGKANALRTGFTAARHPIVVALDADTLFTPSTVGHLVQALGNPRVGAVSGNARVGNRVNPLTWFQALEYVLTLNLERRAYALLNCIPVVPGAVGAWRREAVQAVGGFTASTLAEDTDVTLALGQAGYQVAYAPAALAYTEAPQTLRGLISQRTRWSFGTLQCLWKHRRATFSPRTGALGLVAIPGLWLSQVLFPAIAPAMDLGLVLSPLTPSAPRILVATAAYNGALIVLALWALAVDREPFWLAALIPVQNFLYRQFAYAMALKAVLRALRGVRLGWHRVERLGTSTFGRGRTVPDR